MKRLVFAKAWPKLLICCEKDRPWLGLAGASILGLRAFCYGHTPRGMVAAKADLF